MRGIIWISAAILAIGFGGVDSQYVPNSTAVDALKQFSSKSNVLNFYEALKSLYLSGGFSKGNQFNSNVLGQKNISAVLWNQMSDVVKRTQREVKNGDFSMKRMDAQLKLYTILTKSGVRNDLSELMSGIATGSEYPKNLAFAVRDLVAYVAENPQVLEGNKEENVKNWLDAQNLSFNADFSSTLANILVDESESKEEMTDILEALPYQVRGIYPADSEAINDFARDAKQLILQQAQGKTMMASFRAAFRSLTNATDAADTVDNFLYQLASADVTLNTTVVDLEAQGMSLSNRRMGVRKENNRLIRSSNRLVEVLREKNGYPEFKNFSLKSKKALDSGIESLENVRMAMIAGARLIRNLGSIEQAITVAEMVPIAAKSDRDISWRHRVGGALQVIKYLPKASTDNRIGGQILLKSILKESKLYDKMVFLKTKTSNKTLMLAMFEKMKGVGQQTIGNVSRTISTWKVADLKEKLGDISANTRLSMIQGVFGAGVGVKTADDAQNVENFLKSLYDATVTTDNFASICADLITISTDVTDYSGFVQGLVDAVQLSRDGEWQDVWNALSTTSRTLFSTSPNYRNVLGPISYVVNLEGQQMTLINLREAFLALQQLSYGTAEVVEAKVKFIKDFYGGLKPDDVVEMLKAFDVDAEQIGARVTATMYVDDFLDVLETSGSLVGLNKLLGFHRNFTTDAANPDESLKKIIGMITYLQTELAKSAKVKARSIDQITRSNKFQFKNRKN